MDGKNPLIHRSASQPQDEIYLRILKNKLTSTINFQAQQYGESHLKRRLRVRMRIVDTKTFREYSNYLDKNPEEYEKLSKILTVNVTEFFRNPSTFDTIKNMVIPQIIGQKRNTGKKSIRIWSAGCSDGKEVYSLTILLHEFLKDEINDYLITIFASDIDKEILDKGRVGWYSKNEINGIERRYLHKYFVEDGEGYKVTSQLKRFVKFEKRDLITDKKHTMLDLILCRNVVIYFSTPLKMRLYMDFYNALGKGGYFVMGKTETLLGEARTKFNVIDNRERIYQK